jgi:hypothetical protein
MPYLGQKHQMTKVALVIEKTGAAKQDSNPMTKQGKLSLAI